MAERTHSLAVADLLLRLGPINRVLRAAAQRQAGRAARVSRPDVAEYVTDAQAAAFLDAVELPAAPAEREAPWPLLADEAAELLLLREQAAELGAPLPLDGLAAQLGLDEFELGCVLLCAAPEIDSAYERIFGYVLDDLTRRRPSVELALVLAADDAPTRLALRSALAPHGRLRRNAVVEVAGDAPSGLRQELRLAPGVFELLLGEGGSVGDPAAIEVPERVRLTPAELEPRVRRLGRALFDGTVTTLGVWGGDELMRRRAVLVAARAAGLAVRRLDASDLLGEPGAARAALRTASALGTLLWLDADAFATEDPAVAAAADIVARVLCATGPPTCITAPAPWRSGELIRARRYADVELPSLTFADRSTLWADALPGLDPASVADLAARFRVGTPEVLSAAALTESTLLVSPNGHGLADVAAASCATVARRRSYQFARAIRPRRTPADLILPAALHERVVEVAQFLRAGPRAAATWGSPRLSPPSGFRVLFSGESGTGKTLAAEVIAGVLGLHLLKVDLSRVLSKWVGESEKNLEATFSEADGSAAVLFFDEADALFSKRGEVRHGTDRFANLEVGYLLQRLETFEGVVVLATNLRDNLDEAFTRRFDAILNFPRPGLEERRRIWSLAIPPAAVATLDLDALARLDMTGGGIVASAHTAAMLAAAEGSATIEMRHAIEGTARQFGREGRVLSRSQLGDHAGALGA